MKRFFLFFIYIILGHSIRLHSQVQLMGVTYSGGDYGEGTIFSINTSTNTPAVLKSFMNMDGQLPVYSKLLQAANGKMYGTTQSGGQNVYDGILYEYDIVTNSYTKKIDFDPTKGIEPVGSIIQISNGKILGLTKYGGTNGKGVLFEYEIATNSYSKKVEFDGISKGAYPLGGLMQASNGKLYGMTSEGGLNNLGTVFEYDPTTYVFSKKVDFDGFNNGASPCSELMQASDGNLYGMTKLGGNHNLGVLFQYSINNSVYSKLRDFNGALIGSKPLGSLVQAVDGKLYGVTSEGGTTPNGSLVNNGTLFQYDFVLDVFIKKYDFFSPQYNNGFNPSGTLLSASDGSLYGTTLHGGSTGADGTIFKFNPTTNNYTIYNIIGKGFKKSTSTLIQATNGKIYGITDLGGAFGKGALFEFDISTYVYKNRLDFGGNIDGSNPSSSLIKASNGKIYGTARTGGRYDKGTLFEFDLTTNSFIKHFDFGDIFGIGIPSTYPSGPLLEYSNGKFYGLSTESNSTGAYTKGSIYEYSISSGYDDILLFTGGTSNGKAPAGSITKMINGKVYFVTKNGGINDMGTMVEYDPISLSSVKKFDFVGTANGKYPVEGVVVAPDGKLYGLTPGGGNSNKGVLYQYNPVTSILNKRIDFTGGATDGGNPLGKLLLSTDGNFYGITSDGGANNMGILFQYNYITNTLIKKADFSWGKPTDNIIQASDGNIYGVTYMGGTSNMGTVFQFNMTTNVLSKICDFNGTNGKYPSSGLIEINAIPTNITKNIITEDVSVYPNPSNGSFTISTSIIDNNSLLIIYNLLGEEVYQQKITQPAELINTELSTGVYLLKILSDKGIQTKKIIVNKTQSF